ncbi:MAG: hypothetical protein AAF384_15210 [Pseudomonadota bacterium]
MINLIAMRQLFFSLQNRSNFMWPLLLAIASGCATNNAYRPPSEAQTDAANIVGHSKKHGIYDWENFSLVSIDNKAISHFPLSSPWKKKVKIAAGERELVLFSKFNRGLSDPCPCQAFAHLSLQVEAGISYEIRGRISGIDIEFWIEDSTGRVVAGPTKATYHASSKASTTIIM